jgi:hypothetical protein
MYIDLLRSLLFGSGSMAQHGGTPNLGTHVRAIPDAKFRAPTPVSFCTAAQADSTVLQCFQNAHAWTVLMHSPKPKARSQTMWPAAGGATAAPAAAATPAAATPAAAAAPAATTPAAATPTAAAAAAYSVRFGQEELLEETAQGATITKPIAKSRLK